MKKLAFVLIFLAACTTTSVVKNASEGSVFLDNDHVWSHKLVKTQLSYITVRVMSNKCVDALVTVTCNFSDSGALFGVKTITVTAKKSKTVMIYGNTPFEAAHVTCKIEKVVVK